MKILVITSRVPYPLDKGDKLRIYHQLKHLSKQNEVILCCLDDNNTKPDKALEELASEVHIFKLNKVKIAFRLLMALFNNKPFQVNYFFQYNIKRKIDALIEAFNPDHIYCQLIRCSEYVKHQHGISKTLDYMDTFSKGMERRINTSKWWYKAFVKSEHQRLLRYENLIFDYFENKIIISDQDKNYIFHKNRKEIGIVSNGVDTNFFKPKTSAKHYDLVFVGNLSYPPNVMACEYIANEILPQLPPTTSVLFSGASPSPIVESLANKQIKVQGWIDDIRDAYQSSKIFVAPMFSGTGLQNKLLEAMALEIPCLTTILANNALKAEHNKNILVCNNEKEFSNAIIGLLENDAQYQKLAKNGRTFVEDNYSWIRSNEILEDIINKSV